MVMSENKKVFQNIGLVQFLCLRDNVMSMSHHWILLLHRLLLQLFEDSLLDKSDPLDNGDAHLFLFTFLTFLSYYRGTSMSLESDIVVLLLMPLLFEPSGLTYLVYQRQERAPHHIRGFLKTLKFTVPKSNLSQKSLIYSLNRLKTLKTQTLYFLNTYSSIP